jgi:hypothetical protein
VKYELLKPCFRFHVSQVKTPRNGASKAVTTRMKAV